MIRAWTDRYRVRRAVTDAVRRDLAGRVPLAGRSMSRDDEPTCGLKDET